MPRHSFPFTDSHADNSFAVLLMLLMVSSKVGMSMPNLSISHHTSVSSLAK